MLVIPSGDGGSPTKQRSTTTLSKLDESDHVDVKIPSALLVWSDLLLQNAVAQQDC